MTNSKMMSKISKFMEQQELDRLGDPLIELIDPDPDQDRHSWDTQETKEHVNMIAESIKVNGVRRPIEVYEHTPGRYKIIAGEVRYRASLQAGMKNIPVLLRLKSDAKQRSMDMLTENISRLNLAPMELARALKKRVDDGIKRKDILKHIGKSKTWLSIRLGLLKLPQDIQDFAEGCFVRDPSRLYALAKIDEDLREGLFNDIISGKKTTESILADYKSTNKKPSVKGKVFKPSFKATKNEVNLILSNHYPLVECSSDELLEKGFKRFLDDVVSGMFIRKTDDNDNPKS